MWFRVGQSGPGEKDLLSGDRQFFKIRTFPITEPELVYNMLHMVSFAVSFCVFYAAHGQLKGQGDSPECGAFVSRSFKSRSLRSPSPCLFAAGLNETCAVRRWNCKNETSAPQSTWAHSLSFQIKLPNRARCSYTNTTDLSGPEKQSAIMLYCHLLSNGKSIHVPSLLQLDRTPHPAAGHAPNSP